MLIKGIRKVFIFIFLFEIFHEWYDSKDKTLERNMRRIFWVQGNISFCDAEVGRTYGLLNSATVAEWERFKAQREVYSTRGYKYVGKRYTNISWQDLVQLIKTIQITEIETWKFTEMQRNEYFKSLTWKGRKRLKIMTLWY